MPQAPSPSLFLFLILLSCWSHPFLQESVLTSDWFIFPVLAPPGYLQLPNAADVGRGGRGEQTRGEQMRAELGPSQGKSSSSKTPWGMLGSELTWAWCEGTPWTPMVLNISLWVRFSSFHSADMLYARYCSVQNTFSYPVKFFFSLTHRLFRIVWLNVQAVGGFCRVISFFLLYWRIALLFHLHGNVGTLETCLWLPSFLLRSQLSTLFLFL